MKDFVKAEEHYKLAMKVAPTYSASYINYAYLLSALKGQDDLEAHLKLCNNVPGINKATFDNEWAIYYEGRECLMKLLPNTRNIFYNCTITTRLILPWQALIVVKRKKKYLKISK